MMKTGRSKAFLCIIFLGLLTSVSLAATLSVLPESRLWLTGDSTLHPFTSQTQTLTVIADFSVGAAQNPYQAIAAQNALQTLLLTIPVKTLKSKESALDKNMYKALKEEAHRDIVFSLSHYQLLPSAKGEVLYEGTVMGKLTIAGVEQSVALPVEATVESSGLRIQGRYPLKMTDYGVKPPTMMLGAVRVKDDVVIEFDLRLR